MPRLTQNAYACHRHLQDDGTTPLMLACQEEDTAAVSSLLEAGADVNIVAVRRRASM